MELQWVRGREFLSPEIATFAVALAMSAAYLSRQRKVPSDDGVSKLAVSAKENLGA